MPTITYGGSRLALNFDIGTAVVYGGAMCGLALALVFVGAVLPAAWAGDARKRKDALRVLDRLLRFFRPQR